MKEQQIANGILLTLEPSSLPEILLTPIRERWSLEEDDELFEEMLEKAASLARPCAFLRPAKVDSVEGNNVSLDGHTFSSPLVASKLHTPGMTAVAYVSTCGRQMYDAKELYKDDFFADILWDELCMAYLRLAGDMVQKYMMAHFFPPVDGKKAFAALNPGSLEAWPISAQRDLFAFLGEGADLTGVELSKSLLMVPTKSTSGIFFPTDKPYENCMHCPRIDCPGRRMPYQEHE